jgi:hypothetical protein
MDPAELKTKSVAELDALLDELVKKRKNSSGDEKQECTDAIGLVESVISDINDAALMNAAKKVGEATDQLEGFAQGIKSKPLSQAFDGTVDKLNKLSGTG